MMCVWRQLMILDKPLQQVQRLTEFRCDRMVMVGSRGLCRGSSGSRSYVIAEPASIGADGSGKLFIKSSSSSCAGLGIVPFVEFAPLLLLCDPFVPSAEGRLGENALRSFPSPSSPAPSPSPPRLIFFRLNPLIYQNH